MSHRSLFLSRSNQNRWFARLCALIACLSPAKFSGISGWLGAGGFLLFAAVAFTTPQLVSAPQDHSRTSPLKLVLMAISLLLIVASVVVWRIER
ncbi:hypothetical protein D9M71_679390 [compost metagenome]